MLADYDQFGMPRMITTEEAEKRQKISKCRVCMKNVSASGAAGGRQDGYLSFNN